MTPRFTRRDFVRAGGVAAVATLAGCGAGGGDPSPGNASENESAGGNATASGDGATDGDVAGGGTDAVAGGGDAAIVGQTVEYPSLEFLVTEATTIPTLQRGTVELEPDEGMTFYRLRYAFRNVDDAYLALGFDAFELDDGTGERHDVEDFFSPELLANFGGLALAPGEMQTATATFEIPVDAPAPTLHVTPSVRRLPADFEALPEAAVDVVSAAETPATLTQTFRNVPGVGEEARVAGITARVADVAFVDEVPEFDRPEGVEYAVVDLSVANDSAIPIVADVGGVGGMALTDALGRSFARRLELPGEFEGRPAYDGELVEPGQSAAGVRIVEVAPDASPLYFTYAVASDLWAVGTGEAVNKLVWRLR
ncbi:DUF4352 domain-containing protein [Halobium salinum]|uniref:DUF4352 domain-containing protein n=1 Tax=Halobium salinum TaxID=1364940 RepID=A0ABD5PG63_9EURY|nr:hypothetical protein [Halobium salinum]